MFRHSVVVLLLALFHFRITAGCGGTYTASSGEIKSPNYPNNYYASYTCTYTISTPPTSLILLTFQDFQLEACCDYLEIYDGDSMSAVKLGQFNGVILPPQIYSSLNRLYLRFRTDSSGQYRGFHVNYTSLLPEVQNISVTAISSTAVRVNWQPPNTTLFNVLNYTVTMWPLARHHSPTPGCPALPPLHTNLSVVLNGLTVEADIHYLVPDVYFQVTLTATMAAGQGPTSTPITALTLPKASDPVRDLTVEVKDKLDNTTVSWRAPCDSGGVLGHFLVLLEGHATRGHPAENHTLDRAIVQPMEESYSICITTSSLTAETQYKVTVIPVGPHGLYGANRTTTFHVPARVPTEPQNVSVTALSSSAVRVHWQPPAQSHGTIHNYTVTLHPLASHHSLALGCPAAPPLHSTIATLSGSTLEVDVHYLLEDVEYEVTVKAATAAGSGQTSVPATACTLPAASGPVRNLTVEVRNSNGTQVSWQAPCDSGGFLSHFLVELEMEDSQEPRSISGNHTWNVHLTQSPEETYSMTVSTSSLAAGERYRVTVTPVGSGGLLGRNRITSFQTPAMVAAGEHLLTADGGRTLWLSLVVVGAAAVVIVVYQAIKRTLDKKRKKEINCKRQAVAAGDLGLDDLLQCD